MAKKRKVRIGIARTPTKKRGSDLIARAKKLEDDPWIIVPKCSPETCGKGHFNKTIKSMQKIDKIKNNERNKDEAVLIAKLQKMSNKGDRLARAYAVSLQIARSKTIPVMAAAKLDHLGELPYVMFRSATDKLKLIGVQYYHRPEVRMLAAAEEMKKKGLHIYSSDSGTICTGTTALPPKKFVDWNMKQIKGIPRSGICTHLTRQVAMDRGPATNGEPYFRLHWKSADRIIATCRRCSGDRHTYSELRKYMMGPDMKSDFEAEAVIHLEPVGDVDEDDLETFYGKDADAEKEYLTGDLSDSALIDLQQEAVDRRITDLNNRVCALDNRYFGTDYVAFIEALTDDPLERRALEAAFDSYTTPVVVHGTTSGKVMQMLWDDCKQEMLMAAAEDKEIVGMVLDNADMSRDTPVKLLKDAEQLARHSEALSDLPTYGKLPPGAALADMLARIYRTEDAKAVAREIERNMSPDTNVIAFTFLTTLELAKGKEWHFTREQMDFGAVLVDYVQALLDADSTADYHEAMVALHHASGGVGDLERQD